MSSDSPSSSLGQIESTLRSAFATKNVPTEVQDAVCEAVRDMLTRYIKGDMRPSELHAGDFIEAVVRLLQWLATGTYTPIGKSLPPMDVFLKKMETTKVDDTLRIHIPRCLYAMYGVRSRRGVGHLPGKISANKVDATLLLTIARWVLAEFIRLFHGKGHADAQEAVDLLAVQEVPLVEEFEETKRVITKMKISLPNQVLILLASVESSTLYREELQRFTKSSTTNVRVALKRLDARNLVHLYDDGRVTLTRLGQKDASQLIYQVAI